MWMEANIEATEYNVITDLVGRKLQIDKLMNQLDISEAFQFAYIGCKSKKGNSQLRNWMTKITNRIRKLENEVVRTVWDYMPKHAKRIGKG
jgi:hypothetical protein